MMRATSSSMDALHSSGSVNADESQSNDGTGVSGSGSGSAEDTHEAVDDGRDRAIGRKETKAVYRIKLVVLFVLIASAAAVATTVYLHLSWAEHERFRAYFADDSAKIAEAIGVRIDKVLGLLDSMGVWFVSYAEVSNQTWPFVSMPNFAVKMAKLLPLMEAICINVLPVVSPTNRKAWETYSVENDQWIRQGMAIQENWDYYYGPVDYSGGSNGVVHDDYVDLPYNLSRNVLPVWQNFPVLPNTTYTKNFDWLSISYAEAYSEIIETHRATITQAYMLLTPGNAQDAEEAALWAAYYDQFIKPEEEAVEPMSDLSYPIISDSLGDVKVAGAADYDRADHQVQGVISASVYWRTYIHKLLPEGSQGIRVVFDNACTESFTYEVRGQTADYLGVGSLYDRKFDNDKDFHREHKLQELLVTGTNESMYTGAPLSSDYCPFTIRLYPSSDMEAYYKTSNPIIFTCAALGIFLFTSLVFILYDITVERRQKFVLQTALHSSAIISSLFPSAVRDRLYPTATKQQPKNKLDALLPEAAKTKLQSYLRDGGSQTMNDPTHVAFADSPIAELYPDTTVLFADISGFTAWSSTRQPAQVFTLLETLYAAFDEIAKQRGVFKVETVGDCYVAAVGLPTPRKAHAVVMARFASDCRSRMDELTLVLEKTLGPGTADLAIRIGMNSGPTTAGVLRGEKSRFQLFGDTVNTAARMESNGERNKIHVSEKTAELLKLAGKQHWLTQRKEQVDCKGKGLLTTFWCEPRVESNVMAEAPTVDPESESKNSTLHDESLQRLVGWNVDVFSGLLKEVVFSRGAGKGKEDVASGKGSSAYKNADHPIDEVAEVLSFPTATEKSNIASKGVDIGSKVAKQLAELIASIATAYQLHPFHNFEHCSHVVMSTKKLLDRISSRQGDIGEENPLIAVQSNILADPLTRFAIMFSALIHDMDHPGVGNVQLINEQHAMAVTYDGKSVAEQNSIDKSWQMIMEPRFADLCACLFATKADVEHFRRILVNVVLATDLFDKNLKAMREARWSKSFSSPVSSVDKEAIDRRTTIILDLIIQASDVSHTMQHFTVYKKWNTCLLTEMYDAFTSGRTTKNPLDGWYEGELWFFDNYVIPLAQKLRECGVFGVSCDEFLDYARDNRMEWEAKGRDIVGEAAMALQEKDGLGGSSSTEVLA